jgi:hypothetical protein
MMDKNTWITRRQFAWLDAAMGGAVAKNVLEQAGIKVEDDTTVADDELGDGTIYRLAAAHGYYIAADVTKRDVMAKMPWLNEAQCDEVASMASENLGDCDIVSDQRSDSIEFMAGELGFWNPHREDAAPFADAEGKTWTVEDVGITACGPVVPFLLIRCSDGRVFEECGSEWTEVKEEVRADA